MQVSFSINKITISIFLVVLVWLSCFTVAAYASYNIFSAHGSVVVDGSDFSITDMTEGDGPLSDYELEDISPNDEMEFNFEVENNYDNPVEVKLSYSVVYTGEETGGHLLAVSWRDPGPEGSVISGRNITCVVNTENSPIFTLDVVAPNDIRPGAYDITVTGVRT